MFFVTIESNVTIVQGIRGLESGVLFENLMPSFLEVIKSENPYLSCLNFFLFSVKEMSNKLFHVG